MVKKLLSALLAIVMTVSLLPAGAWAAQEGSDGESGASSVAEDASAGTENGGGTILSDPGSGVLSAPQNVTAAVQDGSLQIAWEAPAETYANGGAVTYSIKYFTENGQAVTVADVQSPYTLYAYEPVSKYTFQVYAAQGGVTGPAADVTAWTPETSWDFQDWGTGWDSPYASEDNMVYPSLNEQWVAVRTGVTDAVSKAAVTKFVPDTIQVWRGGTGNGQTWPQFIDESITDILSDETDNGYLITFFNSKKEAKGDTTLNFHALTGVGTMSFKLRTNDMNNTDFYIDLRQGDANSAMNKFFTRIKFPAKNTVQLTYNTNTGKDTFGGKQTWTPASDVTAVLTPEQWATFEVDYDFAATEPTLTVRVIVGDAATELGTVTLPEGAAVNRLTWGGTGGLTPGKDRNLLLDDFVRNTKSQPGTDTAPVNQDVEVTAVTVTGDVELVAGGSMGLNAAVEPANAYDSAVIWSSSDESIATVDRNGRVTGLAEGTVRITAASRKTAEVMGYIDIEVVDTASLPLNVGRAITIPVGELRRVKAADGTQASFASDNEAVAAIENNGFIVAMEPGTATITAQSADGKVGTCVVTVAAADYDDYDRMLRKYREYLIPYELPEDESTQQAIDSINPQATALRETMVKTYGDTRASMLWASVDADASNNLHNVFVNLGTLSKAFYLPGEHYHDPELFDDIVNGMDWLLRYVFKGKINHATAKEVANRLGDTEALESSLYNPGWWGHDIGMPWYSAEVLVLMREAGFPQELLEAYCKRINVFVPNSKVRSSGGANMEAANISDMCRPIMLQGLLSKDKERVFQAARELLTSETVATSGSSKFNWDGTFVAHGQHSYELGYGSAFLTAIGDSMKVLAGETIDGEPMPLNETYLDTLLDYTDRTFLPVIWRGAENPGVVGRGISRQGHALLYTRIYEVAYPLYYLLPEMSEEQQLVTKQALKSWVTYNPNLLNSSNIAMNQKLAELANDPTLEARELEGVFARNTGSRAYYRTDDFAFSISMNNANAGINPHEVGNGENLKGLHMGDGAAYLFLENDPLQYMQNYFATFDFKHVPGITVEQRLETEDDYYTSYIPPKSNTATNLGGSAPWNRNKNKNSKHTLAGTAVLTDETGEYGSTAFHMDLSGASSTMDMDVTANKSWFMLGDKIIAMGSNITSTKGRDVDTSVDSRRLPVDSAPVLVWNGTAVDAFGGQTTTENSWAYIGYEVDGKTAQVGYYFPEAGTEISFGGQDHTGSWHENNHGSWYTADSKLDITEPYADLFIHHGVNPTQDTYQYVIRPNMTQAEVEAYAAGQDYTVVAQTDTLHAVYDHGLRVLAINNFADEAVTVESPETGLAYTVSRAAIVIIREGEDGEIQVAIQDPTGSSADVVVSVNGVLLDQEATLERDSCVAVAQGVAGVSVTVSGLPSPEGKKFNTWNARFTVGEADPDYVFVTGLNNPGVSATVGTTTITASVDASVEKLIPELNLLPAEATWKLYSDSAFEHEIENKEMTLSNGANVAFVKVFAPSGALSGVYVLNIEKKAEGAVLGSVEPVDVPSEQDAFPWNLVKGPYASNMHNEFGVYEDRFVVLEFDMVMEALPGKSGLLMTIQGTGGVAPSATENALTSFASAIVRTTPSGEQGKIDVFNGTWVGGVNVPVGQPYELKVVLDREKSVFKVYVNQNGVEQDVYPNGWVSFRNTAKLQDISVIYLGGGSSDTENGKIVISGMRAGQTDGKVNVPIYAMDTDGNPVAGLTYQGEGTLYGTQAVTMGDSAVIEAPAAPEGYRLVGETSAAIASVSEGSVVMFRYVKDAAPVVLDSIEITAGPDKTVYEMGEDFDAAGLVVTAIYSDGAEQVVEDYILTGFDSETSGEKTVTVSYTDDVGETVTASFTVTVAFYVVPVDPVDPVDPADPELPFKDVKEGSWSYEAICYVYESGLMKGVSSDEFAPNGTLSRAMLMTMLARLDGVDTSGGANWYEKGMNWAVENGVSDGTNPTQAITREQFAAMLYRYAGKPETAGDHLAGYSDAALVSGWAKDAMNWAVAQGIVTGRGNNTLAPKGTATRAEAAAMLQRFMEAYN